MPGPPSILNSLCNGTLKMNMTGGQVPDFRVGVRNLCLPVMFILRVPFQRELRIDDELGI